MSERARERLHHAARLWAAGHRVHDIAATVGVGKNAISGWRHRHPDLFPARKIVRLAAKSPARPAAQAPLQGLPAVRSPSPWRTCQWIDPAETKCGAPCLPGRSWCAAHGAIVYAAVKVAHGR